MDDTMTSGASAGAVSRPLSPEEPAGAPAAAEATRSLAGQARQALTGALDGQKGAAADMVEQLAQTVKRSGEQFEGQQDWIASAIGRGAQELNALAGTLRDKDLGDLSAEMGSFARRQPALFVAASAAAGFALARIGKIAAADLSRADLPTLPEAAHDGQ
ncbi:hypothetical protein [Sphingomonas bacterium]|uniref:hypothetical protein n=1 Tax=Sphingomonas bacterium TaxID=1895847 RepID=UPI0015769B22|nr:hypothetical protein [Sphingomonas bacterium]